MALGHRHILLMVKAGRWNIANNALYIQSLQKDIIPFEEEILTETQQLNEYIMTALRTMEGINTKYISTKFGEAAGKLIAASASASMNVQEIGYRKRKIF
jgi:oxygen-independent coproporphyrinogen-3 oxidase